MAKSIENQLKAVSKKLLSLQQTIDTMAASIAKTKTSAAPKPKKAAAPKPKKAKAPKSKKAAAPKPKKATAKKKELTAADTVLGFIQRSKNGVDTKTLIDKTGFGQKKIANIIYKLKKQSTIKSPEKGVYVQA